MILKENARRHMVPETKSISLKMKIKFHQPVTAYALQIGGWLPLAFVSAPILLVDRNIVGMAKQIATNAKRSDLQANRWWFQFINSSPVMLNPIHCAMEGNNNRVPSFTEFVEQFDDAVSVLTKGFPSARVVKFTEKHYQASYEIVCKLSRRYKAERNFLLQVAPIVAKRYKDHELSGIEQRILEVASNSGIVVESSLVLLAVLSCLYEPRDGSEPRIGKKLIKPTNPYIEAKAHNALSDLRALELLIAANTMGGPAVAFCTRDKYLAAFWCAIQASNAQRTHDDTVRCDLVFGEQLFPRLSKKEVVGLVNRLKSKGLLTTTST
jgi:hypothetical protein